jgi:hypothetical protein
LKKALTTDTISPMAVYRISSDKIEPLPETSFPERGMRERRDIQRLLRANIQVVAPDVLLIGEEFAEWDDSKRRIDLLGVDNNGNLVVIELKRDDEGGHMELQAIRYAAMVSSMTFSRAADVFQAYLDRHGFGQDARTQLLEFLEWDEPREDDFARETRIVLVAADFGKELTTAVLWLNERDLDIRCVRMKPYANGDQTLVDVQQVVPLPEAEEYMVRVREKAVTVRDAARDSEDTGYWFMNTGDDGSNNGRSWEDCRKYGFMLAGDGERWMNLMKKLKVGDKLFAYLKGRGYVGLGEVTAEAVPFKDFIPSGSSQALPEVPLTAQYQAERMTDPEHWDLCVAVRWINSLDRDEAVLMNRARQGTLSRIKQPQLVTELLKTFNPTNAPT